MLLAMPDVDAGALSSLLAQLRDLGIMGALVIALWLGYKGAVITRSAADREVAAVERLLTDEKADRAKVELERDEWKAMSLELLQTAQRATAVADKAVTHG